MHEATLQGRQAMRLIYRLNEQGKVFRLFALRGEQVEHSPFSEAELRSLRSKLHPLDMAIVAELLNGSVFGVLSPRQLGRLLPLLAERTTWLLNQALEVRRKPIGVRLRLELLPNQASLAVLQFSPKPGVLWELSQGRLLIGSEAFFLREGVAYPIGVRSPEVLLAWTEPNFRQLQAEDLEPEGRARLLKDLRQLRIPEEDLASLAIEQGKIVQFVVRLQPDMVANVEQLDGAATYTEPRLQAVLAANYGVGEVLLSQGSGKWQYLTSNGSDEQMPGTLLERDNEAERAAITTLQQLGFVYEPTRSVFVAVGDVAIAANEVGSTFFPPNWQVQRGDGGLRILSDLRLRTAVQYLPQQSSVDVKVQLELVGGLSDAQQDDAAVAALIELKELLGWLGTGRKYLRLKDGRYVKPSAELKRSLLVLADLGITDGRALVSPLCAGLLRRLGDHTAVDLVDQATKAWLEEISGAAKPAEIEPPAGLNATLRDYQRRGLDWLMMLHRYRLAGVLADDMGLGKTVQTLSLLLTLQEQEGSKPSLVVVPTSVLGVWQDEITRFAPSLKVIAWYGAPEERRKLVITSSDVVVTSYGILRRDIDLLAAVSFRYVILDEAQLTKNAHSQTAQVVRQLKSERRLALSGTPLENRPEELWSIFDFLAPGFLGSLRQFRKRYALPMSRGEEGPGRLLRARLGPLILRRLKQEVAGELPPKTESVLRCVLGTNQRALYDHVAGRLRESVLSKIAQVGIEKAQIDILAALTRLRQICCDPRLLPAPPDAKIPPSAKLALFAEIIREALASCRAVLVFSQFVQMQRYLVDVIRHLGVDPLWLHGASKGRDGIVRAFQDPNGPPVIVVSLRAGGLGLTLTRADTVIHYDPWWNPAVEQQATDRAHRIGQDHAVTVYKLICQSTIEERVVALGESKRALAESILTSEGSALPKLITRDDVLALLG